MSDIKAMIERGTAVRNAQLDRVNVAAQARPHLDLSDFARAVEVFGWPSAAARGCLLGLVESAWGDDFIVEIDSLGGVKVWDGEGYGCEVRPGFKGDHRADVNTNLTAALEAAPMEAP